MDSIIVRFLNNTPLLSVWGNLGQKWQDAGHSHFSCDAKPWKNEREKIPWESPGFKFRTLTLDLEDQFHPHNL